MSDRLGPFDPDRPDDETARRLRELLAQEARAITPDADALMVIRQRIRAARGGPSTWMRAFQIGGAGLATAAIAVIAVVAVQHKPGTNHRATPGASSSASMSSAPSTTNSAPPSSASQSQSTTYPVWIYYVGKLADPQRLLYRESVVRPRPVANAFITDAVNALLTTTATDPDYTSYWPIGTALVAANISGTNVAVINLSAAAASTTPADSGKGDISLQQMLYTIHTAAPKIDTLSLQIAGQPVTSLWGTPIAGPIALKPASGVFSHVWITQPAYGATLPSSFTFGGEATVVEANVSWELLQKGGRLQSGFVTASIGAPERGTWSVQLNGLAPGKYTLRAWETSMKDGSITYLDDKVVTVG
jgi:spore germination protein GerM